MIWGSFIFSKNLIIFQDFPDLSLLHSCIAAHRRRRRLAARGEALTVSALTSLLVTRLLYFLMLIKVSQLMSEPLVGSISALLHDTTVIPP